MTLDYDDLGQATKAHSLLRQHRLKVTFFPNLPSTLVLRGVSPKLFHRIMVNAADAERANELLREAALLPPS